MAASVIVAVIGICGLATMVSTQTDKLVAATSHRDNSVQTTLTAQAADTMGSPANTLNTLPDPATSSSTVSIRQNTSVVRCNTGLQAAANAQHRAQLQRESVRHNDAILSLKTTGLVTKFLNPYMYNSRLSRENDNHHNVILQIERHYQAAITNAHC